VAGQNARDTNAEIDMASKVNVKFVATLGAGIVTLVGALGLAAYFLLVNSAADLAKKGDKALAKDDIPSAIVYYSKAVDKERTNITYLGKWRDALGKKSPETRQQFIEAFRSWVGIARQMALVQRDNLADQVAYGDIVREQYLTGPVNREANKRAISEMDTLIGYYSGKPAGEWEKLKKIRGIARLRAVTDAPDSTDQQWLEAKDDLEAAAKADPGDADTALALVSYYALQADRAERRNDPEGFDKMLGKAREIETDFIARNDADAMVRLSKIRLELQVAAREFSITAKNTPAGSEPPDVIAAGQAFTAKVAPMFEDASQRAMKLPPEEIDLVLLGLHRQMEETFSPSTRLSKTEALLTRALEKRPNDAGLLMYKADLASERADFPLAIATAEKVMNLPLLPVGIPGSSLFGQKDTSRFLRVLWGVKQYMAAAPGDRDGIMQRVRQYRQDLAANESQDSPRLQLADAWVAQAEEQWDKADRLLEQLERTNRIGDVDTLLMWANIALKRGQTGKAEEHLTNALAVSPQNVPAAVALADLNLKLENPVAAVQILENLVRLQPGNKFLADRLQNAKALAGLGKSDDPVMQTLIDADKLNKPRPGATDPGQDVVKFLLDAMKRLPADARLYSALAGSYLNVGDRDNAIATVKAGLAKFPDSQQLKSFDLQLSTKDPVDGRLLLIEQSDKPALDKCLERYAVLSTAVPERQAEADAEIAKMKALAPDDARVVEVMFLDALKRRSLDEAAQLVEKATKIDADHLGGKTFQARLLSTKGDFESATKVMQEVIGQGGAQPETWRLLGRFQAQLGRWADAANSFREALKQRPEDAGAVNDLIDALNSSGQREQALVVARQSQKFPAVGANRDFVDRWLNLEQEIGDRAVAKARREQIAKSDIGNRDNLQALASIYMNGGEFENARKVIDKIRAGGDDLESIRLDAQYSWMQRDPVKATKLYEEFVNLQKDRNKLVAQLNYANFLLSVDRADDALKQLDAARSLQDPKQLEADRAIAETTFRLGRYKDAAEAMRRIIASGGDGEGNIFRKRLVETLTRSGDYDGAEKELAPLLAGKDPDAVTLLLDAEIKIGASKEHKGAIEVLNRAVARFPAESSVFVKRGQFLMNDETRIKDAIEDFSKAIQLSPNSWQVYRLRASAYGSIKGTDAERDRNVDKAIADWIKAVQLNPGDDSQLNDLVFRMIQLKRDQDAEKMADEALSARPLSANGFSRVGSIFQTLGRNKTAAKYFEQAFKLDPADGIAQRLLDSQLAPDGVGWKEAQKLLGVLGQPRVNSNPGFLLALAKVQMAEGQVNNAGRSAIQSLQLLNPANPTLMLSWDNDMKKLIPVPTRYIAFLDDLVKRGSVPNANEWLVYFRNTLAVNEASFKADAITQLGRLAADATGKEARQFARRAHGAILFGDKRYEEAGQSMAAGLKDFPNDPELLNNYSFLLAKYLNKPADALPLAEQLLQLIKDDPAPQAEILDSIGFVYRANNKCDDAAKILQQAVNFARSARAGISAATHLADALQCAGKADQAKQTLSQAAALLAGTTEDMPDKDVMKAELDALKAKLGE
jgi:tetratricopeptide (TPR) repeat protein